MTGQKYQDFIASIDNSVAGSDFHGNLASHVDCSVQANAEAGATDDDLISQAKMILDCWESFYPQLAGDR